MTREPAAATQLIDDKRVRVTRFDFAPGAETGWHVHAMDYVIVTLTDCHMLLDPASIVTVRDVPPGSSSSM